jgi:hypothetical protein
LPGYPGINIFLSKEHVMKRHLFPLLVLALILPVLAGCPQDSGDSTPGGTLGDDELVLKGTVYTLTFDESTFRYTPVPYTTAGTVKVMASAGGTPEELGEGLLADGKFNISVTKKPANLAAFDANAVANLFDDWDSPAADPADAKGAQVYLQLAGGDSISKLKITISGTESNYKATQEGVMYLYVDKDVTITLGAKVDSDTDEEGATYTVTYKAATLKLTKGWNALYQEMEATGTETATSGTASVSVKNPDLDWVLSD